MRQVKELCSVKQGDSLHPGSNGTAAILSSPFCLNTKLVFPACIDALGSSSVCLISNLAILRLSLVSEPLLFPLSSKNGVSRQGGVQRGGIFLSAPG